jgi:hypothetical protein
MQRISSDQRHRQSRAKATHNSECKHCGRFQTPRRRIAEIGCKGEVEGGYGDQEQTI